MLSSKSGVTDGSRSEDRPQARLIMMKDAGFTLLKPSTGPADDRDALLREVFGP
jgi:hypothetical protein